MKLLENIYHTDNATDQEVVDNFTIRQKEFDSIIKVLKSQGKKSLQHFLLVGKRGMGKSTLLRRIEIELKEAEFKERIITIRLGGEGYRISKLFKLWEQIVDILAIEQPSIKETLIELEDSVHYEDNIVDVIADYLANSKKTLLLLIDNFDTIIKTLSSKEQHSLREILITHPVQIIGNTLFYEEHFYSYNQPFFDFFKVIKLKNLTKEESIEFITTILENENKDGRYINENKRLSTISTLRILSGGVPRTIVFLMSVLFDDSVETTMQHLKKLNELVTPLYQDRMNHLSPQQREIVWAMAMQWDKTGVKEIAKITRMESKNVSAQLRALEQNGYVVKTDTPGRNKYYLIDERYFNIWLLMSEGTPYDGKRVLWLTKSLDMLLDIDELKHYAQKCLGNFEEEENKFLLTQALLQSEKLGSYDKLSLINNYNADVANSLENRKWLTKQKDIILSESDTVIASLFASEKYDEIITLVEEIKNTGDGKYFDLLGHIYQNHLGNYNKAESSFLSAIQLGDNEAIFHLAFLYHKDLDDYSKAEFYYSEYIKLGHPEVNYGLGILYQVSLQEFEKAEQCYMLAMENNVSEAIEALASLYINGFKDVEKAKLYYEIAVGKGSVKAMIGYANMLDVVLGNFEESEKYYLMAIRKKDSQALIEIARLYYKYAQKKEEALVFAKEYSLSNRLPIDDIQIAVVLLWNGKVQEALQFLQDLKFDLGAIDINERRLWSIFLSILVFKQRNIMYKLFNSNSWLKEMYKPIYFTLLLEMKAEKEGEFLTMPPEVKEAVNDLVKAIERQRNKYGVA